MRFRVEDFGTFKVGPNDAGVFRVVCDRVKGLRFRVRHTAHILLDHSPYGSRGEKKKNLGVPHGGVRGFRPPSIPGYYVTKFHPEVNCVRQVDI